MEIHIGTLLKSMRQHRNLTQDEVAVLIGSSKSNVAQLEANPTCSTRVLFQVARALDFYIEINCEPLPIKNIQPPNFL